MGQTVEDGVEVRNSTDYINTMPENAGTEPVTGKHGPIHIVSPVV
jgi:hypothetical protein